MSAKSVYRLLLAFYPAAFRDEYGSQMTLAFTEQLGEARRSGRWWNSLSLWAGVLVDTIFAASAEHIHVTGQDLRYALRTMQANRGFTVVAVTSLALGIGANTAIFSLWNSELHASLPGVRKPGQLVMFTNPSMSGMWHGQEDGERTLMTFAEFEQLRDQSDSFSGLIATQSALDTWQVRLGGDWERVRGRMVSGDYFRMLGVQPEIGRTFTEADDHTAAPYAVLSYDYWRKRFGGREDVLGQTLRFREATLTVIGVARAGFYGETVGQAPDVWAPLTMQPALLAGEDRLHDSPPEKVMWLHVFGRLKPGIGMAHASSQAQSIFKAGLESFYGAAPEDKRREMLDQHLKLRPAARGASPDRDAFSGSLTVMLAAVGVLMMIACANLANLLLAQGTARRPEIALRLSLGASRGRLIRQLVTESLFLALVGAALGLGAAYVLHLGLAKMMTSFDSLFQMNFSVDPAVLWFTLAVTIAAVLLFGALPAWQATRTDATTSLKEESRITNASGVRWGRLLVILQLALCIPLLVAAGLLVRTFYNLEHIDLGYSASRVALAEVDWQATNYDEVRRTQVARQLQAALRSIPGVAAASYSSLGLFSGGASTTEFFIDGASKQNEEAPDSVGPDYFAAVGIPILQGRDIKEQDGPGAARSCVINKAFANKYFAGQDPIGRHILTAIGFESIRTDYQVVGVAKDARTARDIRSPVIPRVYLPMAQPPSRAPGKTSPQQPNRFLVRSVADSPALLPAVMHTIQRVDDSLPVDSVRTAEEQLAPSLAPDRVTAQLAGAFGASALALAAVGLYGVVAYSVARRRNELAIRVALGALPRRVTAMILWETARMVIVGLAAGWTLTYGVSKLIASQLYGVSPLGLGTASAAGAILVATMLGAAYLPARRVTRLDAMAALRQQ
jgi:predicted permease